MNSEASPAWSGRKVKAGFNEIPSILHYTRAAHFLGLWKSERLMIERFLADRSLPMVEAGCGAGRVTLGLWKLGYTQIWAFDFAKELLDQAQSLAKEYGAVSLKFVYADATTVKRTTLGKVPAMGFGAALFMFNGLMQIPGRGQRRKALRRLRLLCREDAPLLFTTHDRDRARDEVVWWRHEVARWAAGEQDPRLCDFGDRLFHDESGQVFMHVADRSEVLADLAATGWVHEFDTMRSQLASESAAVTDFSDDCRFWVARAASTRRRGLR